MLRSLLVRDFALIEQAELELAAGLTVLTGETGAGKSMLVDALLLIAGARSSGDLLRRDAQRAEVTAEFAATPAAAAWLAAHDIDHQGEIILRRSIGADGRSRAFVNAQLVPLQALREVADLLIEIHGQQEFQRLVDPRAQRALLDAHGVSAALLAEVTSAFEEWRASRTARDDLALAAASRTSKLTELRAAVQELAAIGTHDAVMALLDDRKRIANRGKLAAAASSALQSVDAAEGANAHDLLARGSTAVRSFVDSDAELARIAALLEDARIGAREAADGLAAYLQALDVDPAKVDDIERRAAAIEALARKHRVDALDLARHAQALGAELNAVESADVALAGLQEKYEAAASAYREAASRLGAARRAAAQGLSAKVSALMQELGMRGGRFDIVVAERSQEFSAHGADDVEFLVSANPGLELKPLARIASGGELSRISLAIQVAGAADSSEVCRVFDEVDAGVGGAVAEMVGRQLAVLAQRSQILCVTHLPQVASQADTHFRVAKLHAGATTRLQIERIREAERVEEIARMLGGVTLSEQARAHAREMLGYAGQSAAARRSGARRKSI